MIEEEPLSIAPISLIVNHEPGESRNPRNESKKPKKFRRKQIHCFILYFFGLAFFTLFGGLIFWAVENEASKTYRSDFDSQCLERKKELIQKFEAEIESIINKSQSINSRSFVAFFNNSLGDFEECMRKKVPEFAIPHIFDFLSSTVYSVTIYTTVGYGDLITRTPFGRILTIFYGFFGIPFYIAFISDFGGFLGKQLNGLGKCFRNLFLRIFKKRFSEEPLSSKFRFFFITSMLILFIGMITEAIQQAEILNQKPWTFMDSLHFVFSTVSLVGFGDIIASHQFYLPLYLPLFMIGQSLCALSFYYIQRFIRYSIPQFLTTSICLKFFQPSCDASSENPSIIENPKNDENGIHERLTPCHPNEAEDHSETISVFAHH